MLHERYYIEKEKQEKLLARKNEKSDFYNGVFDRYEYPVLTREHIPLTWRYDLNPDTNPYFMERLGINAVMNSGAIELNGKYYLVARIEGNDRKSFFGVAESDNGIDGFRFWDYPILLPDTCPKETNVYDMRLTKHEDGYIYGVFCSESKDTSVSDLSAAVAAAGIVRTKDLKTWERLPNLVTLRSPQQRNVVLHPEFVDGKYAFYTRPMDDFIETGSGGGIGFGLCEDITHAVIDEEKMTKSAQVSHDHGGEERSRCDADQDGKGMDSYRSRCAQHGSGTALCYLCVCNGLKRSVESDCRAVRASDRTERRGARRGCQQCGIHQRSGRQ